MTKIILNADDFGKSIEQNQAIDESFKQGLVESAGLIITAKYLEDALNKAIAGGYMDKLHLHVNLSSGNLYQDTDYVPLTDAMKRNPYAGKNGRLLRYKQKSFGFLSVFDARFVYREIEAQYKRFIAITDGKGDIKHIDFHLWYNLTWPVSIALFFFTRRYKIQSVRYFGEHLKKSIRCKLYKIISWNPNVIDIPSTNIDYFISRRELFRQYPVIELYCHPNFKNGILLDDSDSYLHHEKKTMQYHIQQLNEIENIELISWEQTIK